MKRLRLLIVARGPMAQRLLEAEAAAEAQRAHLRLVHARRPEPVRSDAPLAALMIASVLLLLAGLLLIAWRTL